MTHQQLPIRGPFKGVISDLLSPQSPLNAFDDVLNFFIRKGAAHLRPVLNPFGSAEPSVARTFGNFKDILNNYHTFKLVKYSAGFSPALMLDNLGQWNGLGFPALAAGQLGSSLPFANAYTQNQVYFANLGYPLWYLDGSNLIKSANSPGTCRFLAICANHLIQAYTIEPAPNITGSTINSRRVRWSATNNPQQWDPLVDFTAGFNDLLDVPDEITGIASLSASAYIWRSNGITLMFPTGIGTSPFDFENYSLAPEGIGNVFPDALSTFDNRTAFISDFDLHLFDASSFSSIGGMNTKKIFADLASASGDVVWGKIIPGFPGLDFLSYWLTIPGINVTWIYSFTEDLWVRFTSSQGALTALRTVVTS